MPRRQCYLAVRVLDGEEDGEESRLPGGPHGLPHELPALGEHAPSVRHDEQQLRQLRPRARTALSHRQQLRGEVHHPPHTGLTMDCIKRTRHSV